jgi:hypothetical protein
MRFLKNARSSFCSHFRGDAGAHFTRTSSSLSGRGDREKFRDYTWPRTAAAVFHR